MKIKLLTLRLSLAAATLSLLGLTAGCDPLGGTNEANMADYEQQLKTEAQDRIADPAWKPAAEEVAVIQIGEKGKGGLLHNYCLATNGNILACWGTAASAQIKVYSPDGKFLQAWPLSFSPEAVCVASDGTVFVGGAGRLAKLDSAGKLLASAASPAPPSSPTNGRARMNITGIAVSGDDLFVACPSPSDYTYTVYRLDRDLKTPVRIIKDLHGCCGQMDVQAHDGTVWIPHNARHLVESYDRNGKKLSSFGRTDRKAADGFGGCCEPKNLRISADGTIYAAESGEPVVIKRFSPAGKFGGVVALPNYKSGCVRVTVEVSPDGKRFYILDTGDDAIHVFAAKS